MTRKLGKLHEYKLCFYSKISFSSGLIIYTWQIFNFVNRFSNRESKKMQGNNGNVNKQNESAIETWNPEK